MKGNKSISGKYHKMIYELEKDQALKTGRRLSYGTLYPDNFQKQNVNRAVYVFSQEMIGSIKTYKEAGTPGIFAIDETITFMEHINKLVQSSINLC